MGILDRLLGRKNKKDTIDHEIKTDMPIVKTEINRQDVRDAMMGKNGKTTVLDIAIDTITMHEIPMRDKLSGIITTRGIVTSTQCFNRVTTHNYPFNSDIVVLTKSMKRTQFLELIIGEKVFVLPNDNSLPEVNIGDDVEIMHVPDSHTAKTPNSSGGDVRVVLVLKNHTSGELWCFSIRRHALGF
jgi:hypothetical protein